ncbi:hypothetical protein GGR56DRAFT_637778 [Xylariaceae sp. FL0804]|nr:hypothetical protein GGR56DRAFT_637778 [Xylariaceae sp. FL0804]
MVGRPVSDDGEVRGPDGEVVGCVSENFVHPPSPSPASEEETGEIGERIPADVLGGLRVDREGNILDAAGNHIGRFHQKPGADGSPLAAPPPPFLNGGGGGGGGSKPEAAASPADNNKGEQQGQKKPKVNAHTGGSPSDIFLDVKSTTDGIQLTIRIPTTFQKQPQPQPQHSD